MKQHRNRQAYLYIVAMLLGVLFFSCKKEAPLSYSTVMESVTVDYEPFENLVHSVPHHLEKQNSDSAFISAKLEKCTSHWTLKFWSSEVQILEFHELDAYEGSHSSSFDSDTLVVEFHDVELIKFELDTSEQLQSVLTIEL